MSVSAPQVGFDDVGLFVYCDQNNWGTPQDQYTTFTPIFNPCVTQFSEEKTVAWEGCCSDLHHLHLIERPMQIKVEF